MRSGWYRRRPGTKSPSATAKASSWSGTPTATATTQQRHGGFVGHKLCAGRARADLRRDLPRRRNADADPHCDQRHDNPGTVWERVRAEPRRRGRDRSLSSGAARSPRASSGRGRPIGRQSGRYRRRPGTKSPLATAKASMWSGTPTATATTPATPRGFWRATAWSSPGWKPTSTMARSPGAPGRQ